MAAHGEPFNICIFVPSGDPEGVRIIEQDVSWSGRAVAFPRGAWPEVSSRLAQPGVYILIGREEETGNHEADLPLLYIGQTGDVAKRIKKHDSDEVFWDQAVAFVSTSNGLNKAHASWLEHKLIHQAKEIGQSKLKNTVTPSEPALNEAEKASTQIFLQRALRILPLIGLHAFESPKYVRPAPRAGEAVRNEPDTVIVPANKDNFESMFLSQHQWWAIRIAGGKLKQIRYIAAYQTSPISAITHWAEVEHIEPYGDNGKHRLIFKGPAQSLSEPIPYGDAGKGAMQAPRYARLDDLRRAKSVTDLFKSRPEDAV